MYKRLKGVPAVCLGLAVVCAVAIALAFKAAAPGGDTDATGSQAAQTDAAQIASNPTQAELTSFAADMSAMYQTYDEQKDFLQRVVLNGEGEACVVSATSSTTLSVPAVASEGAIFVDPAPFVELLGYDASGIVAADGTLRLADGTEVHSDIFQAGDATYYSAQDIARGLACEVSVAVDGSLIFTFPYQSSRIVVRTYGDVADEAALAYSSAIDGVHVLQYATPVKAKAACERFAAQEGVVSAAPDGISFLVEDASEDAATAAATATATATAAATADATWQPDEALSWGNAVVGSADAQVSLVEQYGSVQNIPEVVVAVVDSGADLDHEYLKDRLVAGWDFYGDGTDTSLGSNGLTTGDDDPTDESGHGTHCAGIIANNTASNVKIMPLRCGNTSLPDTAIYSCVEYAVSKNVDIISMSLGGNYGSSWEYTMQYRALRDAECAGILVTAAAGNENSDTAEFYPGADPYTICVSAIDSSKARASYSNYGAAVDLCAPGTNIYSTGYDGGYVYMSGTSMATPFVAACAALVYSVQGKAATAASVTGQLESNACDLGDAGWDKYFGYGCVTASFTTTDASAEVARIDKASYSSLQAAYEAAKDGDTIVLTADVELAETLTIEKSLTFTSLRNQKITRAEGFTGALFDIKANVTMGAGADSAKILYIQGGEGEDAADTDDIGGEGAVGSVAAAAADTADTAAAADIAAAAAAADTAQAGDEPSAQSANSPSPSTTQSPSSLIEVADSGSLCLLESAYVQNNAGAAAITNSGALAIEGAHISGCADAQTGRAIVSSGSVALSLSPAIECGVHLKDNGLLAFAKNYDTSAEAFAISLSDPSQERIIATNDAADPFEFMPFYLTDTSWHAVQNGTDVVLKQATSYDAKIGDTTYVSIYDALEAARNGDSVEICRDIILGDPIVLEKSITVTSSGDNTITVLDRKYHYGVYVGEADVTIACAQGNSLTIDGARKKSLGSLLYINENATLNLGANVVVARNSTREGLDSGSAVINAGTLNIYGAEIINNYSGYNGGGVYNMGTLVFSSGRIANNTSYMAGGGVYSTVGSAFTLCGGSVSGNVAYKDAGGVYTGGTFRMTGGAIKNNYLDESYGQGKIDDSELVAMAQSGLGARISLIAGSITNETLMAYYGIYVEGEFEIGPAFECDVAICLGSDTHIDVAAARTSEIPIALYTANRFDGEVLVCYADGISPSTRDFKVSTTSSHGLAGVTDSLAVSGTTLVLSRSVSNDTSDTAFLVKNLPATASLSYVTTPDGGHRAQEAVYETEQAGKVSVTTVVDGPYIAQAAIADGTLRITAVSPGKTYVTVCAVDSDTGKTVYEKTVEVLVLGVDFLGGSLRIDRLNADGSYVTNYAALRMGYTITFPEGFDANGCSWFWEYGTSGDDLAFRREGSNYEVNADGSITSNIVFTNVPRERFDTNIYTRLNVTYRVDGQTFSFSDDTRTRTVTQVLTAITADSSAKEPDLKYATALLEKAQAAIKAKGAA